MTSDYAKIRERNAKGWFIKPTKPSGFDRKKYEKEYYQKNKDYVNKRQNDWAKKNPEKRKISKRKWVVKNRDRMKYYSKLRHYRNKNAKGFHSFEEIKELFNKFPFCFYCKIHKADSIDHKIPLTKNGTNNIENLIPACISCNSKKGNKTIEEFMAQIKKDFPKL